MAEENSQTRKNIFTCDVADLMKDTRRPQGKPILEEGSGPGRAGAIGSWQIPLHYWETEGFPWCSGRARLPVQGTQEMRVHSLGREDPPEEGMATHTSYSCLVNPMDRGAWRAAVHRVTKSRTKLSTHTCTGKLKLKPVPVEKRQPWGPSFKMRWSYFSSVVLLIRAQVEKQRLPVVLVRQDPPKALKTPPDFKQWTRRGDQHMGGSTCVCEAAEKMNCRFKSLRTEIGGFRHKIWDI